ncbi:polysaccharide deacetylase family protein [Streptomyces sp. KL116D]|uniref:polysaccharide deacetylase family protein n=1 Tax=Streptomyces sp. KL116D TaxID=3045152 RepID=UPI003555D289
MARHGEQRGWYGKLIGAALGVTLRHGRLGVDCAGRCRERVVASGEGPRLQRGVKRVAASIAHASDAGERGVNITIDDGPDPVWTPQVLDVLRSTGVKATFCMVGTQAQAHPDLVKKVVAAGHRLCDTPCRTTRPWTRSPSPTSRGRSCDAERMITKASGGVRPMYYRAPRRSRSPPTAVTSPPPGACGRSAGTWTPRTSSSRAPTPSSPPSRKNCPTGRRSSSTTRAATAPRPLEALRRLLSSSSRATPSDSRCAEPLRPAGRLGRRRAPASPRRQAEEATVRRSRSRSRDRGRGWSWCGRSGAGALVVSSDRAQDRPHERERRPALVRGRPTRLPHTKAWRRRNPRREPVGRAGRRNSAWRSRSCADRGRVRLLR